MSEKATTYLTIMTKNGMFSFLGLIGGEMVDPDDELRPVSAIIKLDPRESEPVMREYPTRHEAIRQFNEAVETSVSRGWRVIHRGQPKWG